MEKKMEKKTYFGLDIYEGRYIKEADIKKLPFYEFWKESAKGSTYCKIDNEAYIDSSNSIIDALNENLSSLKIFNNNDLHKQLDENIKVNEAFAIMDKSIFDFIIEKTLAK